MAEMRIIANDSEAGIIAWTPYKPDWAAVSQACRHVLWVLDGDRELGLEPGGFTRDLILLMCHADEGNMARLTFVYPELMIAVDTYKTDPDGLEIIRRWAQDPHTHPSVGTPKGN